MQKNTATRLIPRFCRPLPPQHVQEKPKNPRNSPKFVQFSCKEPKTKNGLYCQVQPYCVHWGGQTSTR